MNKIAIIGMSFRFPGTTRDTYWKDLLEGRDLVTQVDPSRWALESYLHPDKAHPGTSYTFAAGTLGDIAGFDAEFFGISPREAAQMDPQQRLLLEMSWEAMEDAGIRPRDLRGTSCGVFIGISSADYAYRLAEDLGAVDSAIATGNTSSVAANRISYFFDFRGPSFAIDTACSSSMFAFHQACRSVASGESSLAIAGGVSLLLHPFGFVAFSKASMLSRTGRCRVFDAAGDGYVRSEGGGIFILKDLERALADADPVLAVVAGSAVNADGKKNGLTVPSGAAQAALMHRAYSEAGIDPAEIDYLEAHGTGTAIGDPIEASALAEALGRRRPARRPLLIGSVKSNLGHLEAASGVAGLVKAVHCVRERVVPPTIHFTEPNPNIDFDEWNLRVATEPTAMATSGRVVVGVNSFGFGGANAHVILESAPDKVTPLSAHSPPPPQQPAIPVVVSGRTDAALRAAAHNLAACLRGPHEGSLYDIAYTATCRREWHEHRAVVLGATARSVATHFDQFAEGADTAGAVVGATALPSPVATAFVYSGNGSQWEGMGTRLLAEDETFRSAVQAVEQVFERHSDLSILDELSGRNGPGSLARTEIAQPALFAMQVGITEMLRVRGVMPAVVMGHSVGEIAAAWACGALSLEQAVRLVHHRSLQQARTRGTGQMTAVGMGVEETMDLLATLGIGGDLSIASESSPRGTVVAGPVGALDAMEAALQERGAFFRRLDLDYAFHSAAMDPIEAGIRRDLGFLKPRMSRLPFVSTVTGEVLPGTALGADYWWRNVRDTVRFARAMATAQAMGANLFVEIGPHAVLRGYVGENLKAGARPGRAIATLMRGDGAPDAVSNAALLAMLAGAPVDLRTAFPRQGKLVPLPNYPWQRERHWIEPTADSLRILERFKVHPLLGYRLHPVELAWENQLDTSTAPALADHVVGGSAIFPGAGFAELGLAAADQLHGDEAAQYYDVEDLEIRSPLLFAPGRSKTVRLLVDGTDGSFSIKAREQGTGDPWQAHATGRILAMPREIPLFESRFEPPARPPDFDATGHYGFASRAGLDYGPAFRVVEEGWIDGDGVGARLCLPPEADAGVVPALLHPALLDGAFQLLVHAMRGEAAVRPGVAFVPVRIGRLQLRKAGSAPAFATGRIVRRSPRSLTAEVSLYDGGGERVAWLRDVRFRGVLVRKAPAERFCFVDCVALPMPHAATTGRADPGMARVVADAMSRAKATFEQGGTLKRFADLAEPLLDAYCTSLAESVLRPLARPDGDLPDAALGAFCAGHPEASARVAAFLALLAKDGRLAHSPEGWRFEPPSEGATLLHGDIWNALLADHPEHGEFLRQIGVAGLRLERLVCGASSAAPAMPAPAFATGVFAELLGGDGVHTMQAAIRECLGAMLSALPEGERLRIVEAAGSPPPFVRSLLRALDHDRVDYTVLTPSPEAAEWCRQIRDEFPALGVVATGEGDDGKDEAELPEGLAGLAIVVNDFASESQAMEVLARVRRALLPEGTIVFLGMAHAPWMSLLPGESREAEGEPESATGYLSMADWRRRLEDEGFAPVTGLPLLDGSAAEVVPYAIVALAAPGKAPVSEAVDPRTWVVLRNPDANDGGVLACLRSELESAGSRVEEIDVPGDHMPGVEALAKALAGVKDRCGDIAGIVDLLAIVAPNGDEPPSMAQAVRGCDLLASLGKACALAQVETDCWVVTAGASGLLPGRDPASADIAGAARWGFARSMANEASPLALRLVDIERAAEGASVDPRAVAALARELRLPDAEREVALTRTGARFVARLREMPGPGESGPWRDGIQTPRLDFAMAGQLRNLQWMAVARRAPGAGEIEIEVAATGLNFRDVMYALGVLSDEAVESGFAGASLGLECAGVVTRVGAGAGTHAPGDRVVAFGASCFGRHVIVNAGAAVRLPPSLSAEAAATIPITFFTAWYALDHLARLRPGERVLVHGAAGGVGLAAIQVARHLGAEVFATAGSDEKRDFLRLLGVDRVFDSRSLAFADEILAVTEGEGVDVVLNSLAGEAVNRNLRVLKPFGRLLELGKRDFYDNTRIGLRPFRNNIAYFGIDADQLMQAQPALASSLFAKVMALFAQGEFHALPFHAFEADDVVEAFRFMQQSRHAGKVVVTYRNGIGRVKAPAPAPVLRFRPDATYLVTGGLGGLGLRTGQWLAQRGARHLVLLGRSGAATQESRAAVEALEATGVEVMAATCDVSDGEALAALLAEAARTMPPLAGVFHAAAVIEDALVLNALPGQINRVLAPKLQGALNLDRLTRDMALDCFVMFSSATTLFGNPGQAAYVGANTAIEALAAKRRAAGRPALCVRWGAVEDVGYLARHEEIRKGLQARTGGRLIRADEAMELLEGLMASDESGRGVLDLDWSAIGRLLPLAATPKFSELARRGKGAEARDLGAVDLKAMLAQLGPAELVEALKDLLKSELSEILRIPVERIDDAKSVYDMGMDSLMGVELAMALEQRFGIQVPVMILGENPTLPRLAERIASLVRGVDEGAPPPAQGLAGQVTHMAARHAIEVDPGEIERFASEMHGGERRQAKRIIN